MNKPKLMLSMATILKHETLILKAVSNEISSRVLASEPHVCNCYAGRIYP